MLDRIKKFYNPTDLKPVLMLLCCVALFAIVIAFGVL
jgi:hypothetical protein